jgi:hypothetical protein
MANCVGFQVTVSAVFLLPNLVSTIFTLLLPRLSPVVFFFFSKISLYLFERRLSTVTTLQPTHCSGSSGGPATARLEPTSSTKGWSTGHTRTLEGARRAGG